MLLIGFLALTVAAGVMVATNASSSPTAAPRAVPVSATGAGTARPEPCRGFGFSAPSSWNDPGIDLDRTMTSAVTAGATSVRIGIEWDRVESRRGTLDWSSSDRVVTAARDHGLDVVALLHTTPAWARDPRLTPSNRHTPPGRVEDYVDFATAAAERYGDRVLAWEVWNEPNIADFWFPRADPEAYAELLRATYPALKRESPAVPVVAGALAPSPDTPWSYSPGVYLSSLYRSGVRGSFDAFSVHPYPDPEAVFTAAGREAIWEPVRVSHRIMADNGDGGKQIWITEFGSPTGSGERTVTPDQQSRLMVDAVRHVSGQPWAGPLFLYTVRDESASRTDRESNFGVFEHDWSPKPAVGALARAARSPDCAAVTGR